MKNVSKVTEIRVSKAMSIDVSDNGLSFEIKKKSGESYMPETEVETDERLEVYSGNYDFVIRSKNQDGTEYARYEMSMSVFDNTDIEVDLAALAWTITDDEHAGMFSVDVLGALSIGEKGDTIPDDATIFSKVAEMPVVSVGDAAFADRDSLESVRIEHGIKEIGEAAFASCDNLEKVELGDSVTGISLAAFAYCCALDEIDLPDGLEVIGDDAFAHCTALTEITLPASIEELGNEVFMNCENLLTVYYDGTQEQYDGINKGDDVFKGCENVSVICLQ